MAERAARSVVGEAWAERFSADEHSYYLEGGLPFLRRFARGPFIRLPLAYAPVGPGARVLEAGCGSGKFSLCFALRGCRLTALDYSATILANVAAARGLVEASVGPLELRLCRGDLEHLPLQPGQFDLVINEGVVEHWLDGDERRAVLRAMAGAARPGGAVAVIVPNGAHPRLPHWLEHHPAFLSAPAMVRYDPPLLAADLASIGLTEVRVDGIYAWRTLDWWPTTTARRLLAGVLDRLAPLPRGARLRWGIHLIGVGRKP